MDAPPVVPPTPPLATPAGKKPFAFQAAKASFFAPFFAFGFGIFVALVMMLGSVLTKGNHQPSATTLKITSTTTAIVFILSTLSGLILGIFSLFGVPRYGKKGILGYAIVGVVLNGLPWIYIIISSIVFMIEYKNSIR